MVARMINPSHKRRRSRAKGDEVNMLIQGDYVCVKFTMFYCS